MIYFIQDTTVLNIKIGFTDGDPADRLKALQTGSPAPLVLLYTMRGDMDLERRLHERFASARVHGEWFRPAPALLLFLLDAATRDLPPHDVLIRVVRSVVADVEDYQKRMEYALNG